jgi:hypothetical protein
MQHNGAPAVEAERAVALNPLVEGGQIWISPKAETYLLRMVCQII